MIYSEYLCWLLFRNYLPPELTNHIYFCLVKDYRKRTKTFMHQKLLKRYPHVMEEEPMNSFWPHEYALFRAPVVLWVTPFKRMRLEHLCSTYYDHANEKWITSWVKSVNHVIEWDESIQNWKVIDRESSMSLVNIEMWLDES